MKITFKGDYALKIILDLAMNYNNSVTPIKDISRRQDIPERFLEQIITILKGANYVKTVRGPRGGVRLAKDPGRISVGEIIRLIEGPTSPISCVSKTGYSHCDFEKRCAFHAMFREIRDKINAVVDETNFAEMVKRTRDIEGEAVPDYMI
jgi:Rrf2 family protein